MRDNQNGVFTFHLQQAVQVFPNKNIITDYMVEFSNLEFSGPSPISNDLMGASTQNTLQYLLSIFSMLNSVSSEDKMAINSLSKLFIYIGQFSSKRDIIPSTLIH